MVNEKPKETILGKFTTIIYWFLGSWLAVLIHAVWFVIWLIFRLDIYWLTLVVSLEAIFIGIFILMAENREEERRMFRESDSKKRDLEMMEQDIKLDEKAERRLYDLVRAQKEIVRELEEIKKQLKKQPSYSQKL